ncbi:hypothetical protein EJB05_06818, partial [Eragrostis curvula]
MDLLKKVSSALGFTEKIGEALFDMLYSRGTRLWNMEEEAEKLRRTEKRIRALLTDAEQRRFIDDDFVKLWLQELRASAYDIDVVLDRQRTFNDMSSMAAAEPSRKRKWLGLSVDLGLRQRWELDAWIAKINERLDEIVNCKKKYRLQAGEGRRTAPPMQQRPTFLEAAARRDERPIGRTKEKEVIIRALVADSGIELPVISICGTAGIGKTALARFVYADQEVQSFFTHKIWVWLPDRCDARQATKMIIQAVTRQKCDLLSLDILQQRLREHLSKMKFLLVIDNLWVEGAQFWESLKPSLLAGEKGSKVLVTTQNEMVARMVSNTPNINLKGLEVEEWLQILKIDGFFEAGSSDQQYLESIAQRIAEKCLGSPLAAKSLGVLLSGTNGQREQLESILDDVQFLEHDRNTDVIMASFQISYQHLSYQLKQCFAFCSIYPIGHEFEKDDLVRLWIADGLVKNYGRRTPEMEATSYFNELLQRSFFETSNSFPNPKFRVPTLMLKLARDVCKHECLTLDPDYSPVADHPEWIRYATIVCSTDEPLAFDKIYPYKNLRFLKLCPTIKQVPSAFFSKVTCLRALDFSYTQLDVLPDSIGCAIHLRHLSLRNTSITTLPETVCNLYNLQTLDLRDCYSLMDLPEGLCRLVNMRHLMLHLDWDRVVAFRSMPSSVDKLRSLQTLSRFVVVPRDGGKCNINELRNLKIRGELCLLNLEAATCDGALEANLSGKYLHKLMLKWSDDTCRDEQQKQHIEDSKKIIDALCPHNNLKHLRIEKYPGNELPSWVENLSSLEFLEIISCPGLTQSSVGTLQFVGNVPECFQLSSLAIEKATAELGSLGGTPSRQICPGTSAGRRAKAFALEDLN